jgi:hypothetical protein
VDRAFRAFIVAAGADADYGRRDWMLRPQGAAILVGQFAAWLGTSFIGFTLLLWPFLTGGITQALTVAGSSMTTLGLSEPTGTVPPAILFAAAASSLVIIAPQIAYLPALYAAYNRREPLVAPLNERAGEPPWGPELLARAYYVLAPGAAAIDMLSGLYAQWERWAVDVGNTHSAYLPLVRFRSSRPQTSWVTALLAVLDSAALFPALSPESAPEVPARGCLRSGYFCFSQIAGAMGFRRARGSRSGRNQPQLRGVPPRRYPPARGRLPNRAHRRGGLARVRRVAGQLRARRLRGGEGHRPTASVVVRAAPPCHDAYRAHPPGPRPTAQLGGST